MTIGERFEGCILGGAIGDALGSGYENMKKKENDIFYPFGKPTKQEPAWLITDDTQLTLATIEAMIEEEELNPKTVTNHFLKLYKKRILRGIGASTLKALKELSFGGHWSQVGRKGEFAAGNGAAMRIASLSFRKEISYQKIRDISYITHQSEEAYIGAKCIVIIIREIINGNWCGKENLMELIIDQIPDTNVRDRLIQIKDIDDLSTIGKLGNNGYVVNSVPLAIAAANKVGEIGIEKMYLELIDIGGDTDTNCSIAGQIAGTLIGKNNIPKTLVQKLSKLTEYQWIQNTINNFKEKENWI